MTKEEKIKEVYPSDYHHSDVNGWIRFGMYMPNDLGFTENEIQINENIGVWRPKSLQGIENNNGWIKIESEEDLPKDEDGIYWALKNNEIICIDLVIPIDTKRIYKCFRKDKITHYQPIEKPKPPIY